MKLIELDKYQDAVTELIESEDPDFWYRSVRAGYRVDAAVDRELRLYIEKRTRHLLDCEVPIEEIIEKAKKVKEKRKLAWQAKEKQEEEEYKLRQEVKKAQQQQAEIDKQSIKDYWHTRSHNDNCGCIGHVIGRIQRWW